MRISADVSFLVVIRRFVQAAAEAAQVAAGAIEDLVHAVDELSANIILHGYDGAPGMVEVRCQAASDTFVVILRDTAPAFDPTTHVDPDLNVPLEERGVGGLGIYLSRKMMDEMRYQRLASGENELTLVKRGARPA
jgi:serine/threonine-protein kinase RsbW